jgi:hypothetical protein
LSRETRFSNATEAHQNVIVDMKCFCSSAISLSEEDRLQQIQKIKDQLAACMDLDSERALAAIAARDLVRVHIQRANDNYSAFCEELALEEAKIERRRGEAAAVAAASTTSGTNVGPRAASPQIVVDASPAKSKCIHPLRYFDAIPLIRLLL